MATTVWQQSLAKATEARVAKADALFQKRVRFVEEALKRGEAPCRIERRIGLKKGVLRGYLERRGRRDLAMWFPCTPRKPQVFSEDQKAQRLAYQREWKQEARKNPAYVEKRRRQDRESARRRRAVKKQHPLVVEVELLDHSDTPKQIAERLGYSKLPSLERQLDRLGRHDLAKRFTVTSHETPKSARQEG